MDSDPTRVERFAAWSDLVSLVLVGITIYLGGLTPMRYAWGRPAVNTFFLIIFMTLTIVFSATRFIVEGIFVAPGPREFLVISVIYVARWIWLFIPLNESGSVARGLLVARGLMDLHMVRLGRSTSSSRQGQLEIVIRRGVSEYQKGINYWRGTEKQVQYFLVRDLYLVNLVETRLHSRSLKKLGVAAYKHEQDPLEVDDIIRLVYGLIMTADSANPDLPIDYKPFFDQYNEVLPSTHTAIRTGCTDLSDLATVARRVAFDLAFFITHPDDDIEYRTEAQVQKINECIKISVERFLDGEQGENVPPGDTV